MLEAASKAGARLGCVYMALVFVSTELWKLNDTALYFKMEMYWFI